MGAGRVVHHGHGARPMRPPAEIRPPPLPPARRAQPAPARPGPPGHAPLLDHVDRRRPHRLGRPRDRRRPRLPPAPPRRHLRRDPRLPLPPLRLPRIPRRLLLPAPRHPLAPNFRHARRRTRAPPPGHAARHGRALRVQPLALRRGPVDARCHRRRRPGIQGPRAAPRACGRRGRGAAQGAARGPGGGRGRAAGRGGRAARGRGLHGPRRVCGAQLGAGDGAFGLGTVRGPGVARGGADPAPLAGTLLGPRAARRAAGRSGGGTARPRGPVAVLALHARLCRRLAAGHPRFAVRPRVHAVPPGRPRARGPVARAGPAGVAAAPVRARLRGMAARRVAGLFAGVPGRRAGPRGPGRLRGAPVGQPLAPGGSARQGAGEDVGDGGRGADRGGARGAGAPARGRRGERRRDAGVIRGSCGCCCVAPRRCAPNICLPCCQRVCINRKVAPARVCMLRRWPSAIQVESRRAGCCHTGRTVASGRAGLVVLCLAGAELPDQPRNAISPFAVRPSVAGCCAGSSGRKGQG